MYGWVLAKPSDQSTCLVTAFQSAYQWLAFAAAVQGWAACSWRFRSVQNLDNCCKCRPLMGHWAAKVVSFLASFKGEHASEESWGIYWNALLSFFGTGGCCNTSFEGVCDRLMWMPITDARYASRFARTCVMMHLFNSTCLSWGSIYSVGAGAESGLGINMPRNTTERMWNSTTGIWQRPVHSLQYGMLRTLEHAQKFYVPPGFHFLSRLPKSLSLVKWTSD